ncbi:uncharacterized protein C9orf85 homolog [Homalodisca vitripennis]|uniref:Uncharacterized protein n=1 Tax=Homalodisca liturata TaxID=320908 RepID=A0A1B6HJX1_9HEMI|nr:uncharacterized protein C9orf85 homolog [Homalodisca vitripennis]KAG8307067.1 hypothetical protein J6590_032969 [Homalodisca vitripennis]
MSSQRGNTSRTRPQKHQNTRVFKNNLHDKSKKTQMINKITVTDTCDRCKAIIEWKIKYKKYKQLKNAKTCIKCSNKTVKQSYHTICGVCVQNLKVCAKCGTKDFSNNSAPLLQVEDERSNQDSELSDEDLDCDSDSS